MLWAPLWGQYQQVAQASEECSHTQDRAPYSQLPNSPMSTATTVASQMLPMSDTLLAYPTAQSAEASYNPRAFLAPALGIQEGVQKGMWGTD